MLFLKFLPFFIKPVFIYTSFGFVQCIAFGQLFSLLHFDTLLCDLYTVVLRINLSTMSQQPSNPSHPSHPPYVQYPQPQYPPQYPPPYPPQGINLSNLHGINGMQMNNGNGNINNSNATTTTTTTTTTDTNNNNNNTASHEIGQGNNNVQTTNTNAETAQTICNNNESKNDDSQIGHEFVCLCVIIVFLFENCVCFMILMYE